MPTINYNFNSEAERCDNAFFPRERNPLHFKSRNLTMPSRGSSSSFTWSVCCVWYVIANINLEVTLLSLKYIHIYRSEILSGLNYYVWSGKEWLVFRHLDSMRYETIKIFAKGWCSAGLKTLYWKFLSWGGYAALQLDIKTMLRLRLRIYLKSKLHCVFSWLYN